MPNNNTFIIRDGTVFIWERPTKQFLRQLKKYMKKLGITYEAEIVYCG